MKLTESTIYLDNNSTTAIEPEVLEAMMFDYGATPRNPSSIHAYGRGARNELIKAKRTIADVLGISPEEILFSSGATESNNFLVKGFLSKIKPKKVISCEVEHSCVYRVLEQYKADGFEVVYLPIDESGAPKVEDLEAAIDDQVGLICLMAVNNETGVKFDYHGFAKVAHQHQIPFVSDAVALIGKEKFTIPEGVSAMSFSAHKFHGPKGVGFCYLSQNYEIPPLIIGGGQQNGMRAGTQNLGGALGLAKAVEMLPGLLPDKTQYMESLRDEFESLILSQLDDVFVNGTAPRICNTSNLAFLGCDGESLFLNLDMHGIAASHGSACSSGSLAPSRILTAMGLPLERVESSIRFSISRHTTLEEIHRAAEIIVKTIKQMRSI